MSRETLERSMKLVGAPWKPDLRPTNVVLEGNNRVTSALLEVGTCYIKWFSFNVRECDPVVGRFRCFGFDHRVRDCRFNESNRPIWLHCRNFVLKGPPDVIIGLLYVCYVFHECSALELLSCCNLTVRVRTRLCAS